MHFKAYALVKILGGDLLACTADIAAANSQLSTEWRGNPLIYPEDSLLNCFTDHHILMSRWD